MSSNSKHRKRTREFKARQCKKVIFTPFLVQEEDRLTNLPDCLKTKILSCLPMKDVARTCVLSRKWNQSWTSGWTSVTNLDFDDKPLRPTKLEAKSFEKFVNKVLQLHDKLCLQRFRLKSYGTYDGSLVNAWIASVLPCKVQEFDLHVHIESPVFFPQDLFLCKTLVVLKLDARGKVNIPTSICLPVLKTLHLVKVELPDDVSIVNLVSGCPVLEELSLELFIGKNVGVINIRAPALTSLTIRSSPYEFKAQYSVVSYQVVIDTPALEYLLIRDYEAQSYVIKNLYHLIEAELDIEDPEEDLQFMGNPTAMTDLFNVISRAQSLVLSINTMEAIVLEEFVLPKFCYLTCLKLSTVYDEWTYLPKLLESFPCLGTLHIKDHEYGLSEERRPIDEVSPSCLLTHLKIININVFRGLEYEMEMVEYFLKNAKVLEKLSIFYEWFAVDKLADAKFFQQLLMFPRSSTSCKVEVTWHPCKESWLQSDN